MYKTDVNPDSLMFINFSYVCVFYVSCAYACVFSLVSAPADCLQNQQTILYPVTQTSILFHTEPVMLFLCYLVAPNFR